MEVSYSDGIVGWTLPVQVQHQRDLASERYFDREYTELYQRGVLVRFHVKGKVTQFDWLLLMNSLVQAVVLLPLATTIIVNIAIYIHPKSQVYQPAVKQAFHYEREMSKFAARAALASAQFKRWDTDGSGSLDFQEVTELFEPQFEKQHAEQFAKQIFLTHKRQKREGHDDEVHGDCGCSREKRKAYRKRQRSKRMTLELLSCPELIEILSDDLCNFDTFAAHMMKQKHRHGTDVISDLPSEHKHRVGVGDDVVGKRVSKTVVTAEQQATKGAVEHGGLEKALATASSGAAGAGAGIHTNSSRGGVVASLGRYVKHDTLGHVQEQQKTKQHHRHQDGSGSSSEEEPCPDKSPSRGNSGGRGALGKSHVLTPTSAQSLAAGYARAGGGVGNSPSSIHHVMATGVSRATAAACLKYTAGDATGAVAAAGMVLVVLEQSAGAAGSAGEDRAFAALVECEGDVGAAVQSLSLVAGR
jgi:hypothetical protein